MLLAFWSGQSLAQTEDCSRTSAMEIYSNAFVQKETGDVLGYELPVNRRPGLVVEAFLYVYEGAPNKDGIPVHGQTSGSSVSLRGNWIEHLTEMPSKKKIVETHLVRIDGVIDSSSFKGQLTIEGLGGPESVRLKRVKRIWLCRNVH